MPAALVNALHEAGAACPELAAWCACEDGRKDRCAACLLGSPEVCDARVIKALALKLASAIRQTDEALQQRDWWRTQAIGKP
jgi:hypothetical protein